MLRTQRLDLDLLDHLEHTQVGLRLRVRVCAGVGIHCRRGFEQDDLLLDLAQDGVRDTRFAPGLGAVDVERLGAFTLGALDKRAVRFGARARA
jgi:hypothetical protein